MPLSLLVLPHTRLFCVGDATIVSYTFIHCNPLILRGFCQIWILVIDLHSLFATSLTLVDHVRKRKIVVTSAGSRPSATTQNHQRHHTAACSATPVRMSEPAAGTSLRSSGSSGGGDGERHGGPVGPGATGRGAFLRSSAVLLAGGGSAIAGAATTATTITAAAAATAVVTGSPEAAEAIGDLFEFKDQARFLQHATVQVPDMAAALKFYVQGVGMKVIRTRAGPLFNTTVVGFGPEALEVPPSFVFGVSSTNAYGGHFTLELNEQKEAGASTDEEDAEFFYDPGNGVQFLQVAVDSYRISQVVKAGGIVESGYGFLEVLAPGGLRLKLLSGSRRDPPMFLAVKVKDMKRSEQWYADVAGMSRLPFPYARAPGSPFEPQQPKGTVFMAYEGEAFGVLLVPAGKGDQINPGGIVSLAVLAEDVDGIARDLGGRVSVDSSRGGTRSFPL